MDLGGSGRGGGAVVSQPGRFTQARAVKGGTSGKGLILGRKSDWDSAGLGVWWQSLRLVIST